jgi:SAM-dependent methyltransferase
MPDVPAGDVDYTLIGPGYSNHRRPDPRLESIIHAQLDGARTVLNVGAGAGSYEPLDRHVIAIEPAAEMRRQRQAHLAPAINARAEALPLDDQSVDASLAILTVHQWLDRAQGLRELIRVTSGPIILMTFDGDDLHRFWLDHYAREMIEAERRRYPPISDLCTALSTAGRRAQVLAMPIPIDCTDGFTEAYYARPERFLDPLVTMAQSAWKFVADEVCARFRTRLAADLASGAWDARFGRWRSMSAYEGALRLIVSRPTEWADTSPPMSAVSPHG